MIKTVLFVALAALTLSACGKDKNSDRSDKSEKNEVAYNAEETRPENQPNALPAASNGEEKEVADRAADVKPENQPYIVDFSATWCGPCQQLKPYFHQMEEAYKGQAQFRTVDIDENEALARTHNIEGVPTVIIFSDSTMTRELTRIVGFDPQGIEQAIQEHIQTLH